MARRLRQVVDLYTPGKVVTLKDGLPVWVQPLNPFEQDTARNEALVAKARISLAVKEFGSDEMTKVRMYFLEEGIDAAREHLIEARVAEATPKIVEGIRNDPEWTERLKVLDRGAEATAKPLEESEQQLLTKLANEFAMELGSRISKDREFQHLKYDDMPEEPLWEDYLEWYIERRANAATMAEFQLHQILFGVRVCEGEQAPDGTWDHSGCAGHAEPLFASKEEVRAAPEELLGVLADACAEVDMSVRDAKNSDRQGSSFDSSPLPSVAAESTASTPIETQAAPPGSSSSPSPTPSPSSAGAS